MTRRTVVTGVTLMVVAGLALAFWFATRGPVPSPAGPPKESGAVMSGMEKPVEMPMPAHNGQEKNPKQEMPVASNNTLTIAPERLQTIGVKFEEAARRPLDKMIRTVGRVEIDERLIARVNIKFEGWIDTLLVSAIGDHVKKGQKLFTIYSPDLVATQEEYLLALQGVRELGSSEFPEVARGAKSLLEATKRRFQLWDITEDHIRDLERTGKVLKTLPDPCSHHRHRHHEGGADGHARESWRWSSTRLPISLISGSWRTSMSTSCPSSRSGRGQR